MTVAFLELNDVISSPTMFDGTDRFLRAVAAGEASVDDLAIWIRDGMRFARRAAP